ncbi:hypothetical protein KAU32_01355 [bacterium]|nr:hypothetical protein [bacterium]MCK5598654.1 hypothetical protein [bacterium]
MNDMLFGMFVLFYMLIIPFIGVTVLTKAPLIKAEFAKIKKDITIYRR